MLASLFKRREGCGWWSENRWFYSRSSICSRSWNCAVARRHCKKSGAYNSNWGVLLAIHMTGWSSTGASRGRRKRCQTDWRTRSSLSVLHRISSKQSGMCFLSSSSSSSFPCILSSAMELLFSPSGSAMLASALGRPGGFFTFTTGYFSAWIAFSLYQTRNHSSLLIWVLTAFT